jgi:solute:Na+ symporter, SSS family
MEQPMNADTPSFGAINYLILCTYLAFLFCIGLWFYRRQKTTEEYFLAGRKMPWLMVAMSMFASGTSAISYMGYPGRAFEENISLIAVGIASMFTAPFLILLFYPFYRKLRVTTSYEYASRRYGQPARYLISCLFVMARLGWMGTVIYTPSMALSVVAGINIWLAIVLTGLLAMTYTMLGGLTAVLWTDFVQFIVMVGGAIWLCVSLIHSVPDGAVGIFEIANEANHLRVFDWNLKLTEMCGTVVLLSFFLQFMHDYGIDQVMVQRLLAIKTYKGLIRSIFLNSVFDFIILGMLSFIGLGMFAYFRHFPDRLAANISGDKILPYFIMKALPIGASGFLISGIFAASIGCLEAGLNSLATVLMNDFVRPLRRSAHTEKQDVRTSRYLTCLLGCLAIVIACYVTKIEQVLKASTSFIALFSAPILTMYLLGILSRRAHFTGWLVGAIVAILTTFWIQNHDVWGIRIHFVYYFPICFFISFIIGGLACLVIRGPLGPAELTLWGRHKLKSVDENY